MLKTIFLFPFRQTLCWTAVKWKITIRSHPSLIKPFPQKHLDIVGFIPACFPYDYRMVFAPNHGQLVRRVKDPRYFIKGQAETTGFYPTNQYTLYLLHLFYSDNEIITVHGRPAICTLIGWVKSSHLFISLSGFCGHPFITNPTFTLPVCRKKSQEK